MRLIPAWIFILWTSFLKEDGEKKFIFARIFEHDFLKEFLTSEIVPYHSFYGTFICLYPEIT